MCRHHLCCFQTDRLSHSVSSTGGSTSPTIKGCSVGPGSLGEDLSSLKSIELLLVEVSKPVVVNLVGVTAKAVSNAIANTVGKDSGGSQNAPLGGAELGVLQVSEQAGASGEEKAKTETGGGELDSKASSTALGSVELLLSEEVGLGVVDDLVSSSVGLGIYGVEEPEVPVVNVSEPVASHCFLFSFKLIYSKNLLYLTNH